jgi:regulator of replication initiation timing
MEDQRRLRILNLEKSIAFLLSTSKMSPADMRRYFENPTNLEAFQRALLLTEKECTWFKQQISDTGQSSPPRGGESRSKDVLDLQGKLADASAQISSYQGEIAELKRAISVQEAQNAQLTVENLELRGRLGDSENDATHTGSVVETMRRKTLELSSALAAQQKRADEMKPFKHKFEQAQRDIKFHSSLAVERQTSLDELNEELSLLQSERVALEFNLDRSQKTVRELTAKNQSLENEKKQMVDKDAFLRLQEEVHQLKIASADLVTARIQCQQSEGQLLKKSQKLSAVTEELSSRTEAFRDHSYRIQQQLYDLQDRTAEQFAALSAAVQDIPVGDMLRKARQMIELARHWKRQHDYMLDRHAQNKRSLGFSMQAMAKLAKAPGVTPPRPSQVIENPDLLEVFYTSLSETVHEQARRRKICLTPPSIRKSAISSTLTQINDLMTVMTDQMQEEHDDLMTTLSDGGFVSFRSSRSRI